MGKRSYLTFQHVVENLTKTFVYDVEICSQHPGYKYKFFDSFKELDEHFKKEFGSKWRDEEWAKFWLRDHNRMETQDHNRAEIHKHGKKFRQRTPGSYRYNQIHNPKPRKIPQIDIAAFLKENGSFTLRESVKKIEEHFGINLHYSTVQRIKKKYNI